MSQLRSSETGHIPLGPANRAITVALRRDHQAMRDMYYSEPARFDEILAILAILGNLENRINGIDKCSAIQSCLYACIQKEQNVKMRSDAFC